MLPILKRSKAGDYKEKAGGVRSMLRVDSPVLRLVIFIGMSLVFFLILKVTEQKIPHGLAPDSTAETSAPVHR